MIIHAMERSPMGQPPQLLKLFSCTILWKYFFILVLLPRQSVHTPFGGMDNHLITFISARPLALPDQPEGDTTTTGRAEGVKQHHTHHLRELQMTSTVP